jgi:hypothetical protein
MSPNKSLSIGGCIKSPFGVYTYSVYTEASGDCFTSFMKVIIPLISSASTYELGSKKELP